MTPENIARIEREMDDAGLREVYDHLIEDGNSPNMAAMLASQSAPASKNTDSDFCRRESSRMSSMNEHHLDEVVRIAKRAGINTHGKSYNGQLGKYDDPLAWVSTKDDVKQAAIRKNMDIKGMVNVKAYRPKKKVRLADDIVDRLERNARRKDKSLDEKCKKSDNARRGLRGSLIEKHSKKRD